MPNIQTINEDGVIARAIEAGIVTRSSRRGIYILNSTGNCVSRSRVISLIATHQGDGRYTMNVGWRLIGATRVVQGVNGTVHNAFEEAPRPQPAPRPVLRTIYRQGYHSGSRNYEAALAAITADADGVRRSFGLEYEINSLTGAQEDKLARLLDTLPAHVTERDGSLSSTGVEIVFMPMSEEQYIDTFLKLQQFVRDEVVDMNGTGAHTTYGVNNAVATREDLQIRLNRVALAVKAVGTQRAIERLFGRDFTGYAQLPNSQLRSFNHSAAISCSGRPSDCFEFRLMNYKADVVKVVAFLKSIEFAFSRRVEARDFLNVFEVLGADTEGL